MAELALANSRADEVVLARERGQWGREILIGMERCVDALLACFQFFTLIHCDRSAHPVRAATTTMRCSAESEYARWGSVGLL